MDVDLRFSQSLHTLELHRHMAPYGIDVQYCNYSSLPILV